MTISSYCHVGLRNLFRFNDDTLKIRKTRKEDDDDAAYMIVTISLQLTKPHT